MHVLIFLPVDWMKKTDFILGWGVDALGVGIVEKNIAHSTMIPNLENGVKMQKTITMHCVVVKKRDSKKKTIVRADIQDIVQNVGDITCVDSRNDKSSDKVCSKR
jgi:hypothetical protein